MIDLPNISVFSPHHSTWNWYANDTKEQIHWLFHTEEPQSGWERWFQRPKLSRIFGAIRCIKGAIRQQSAAIAVHGQRGAFWAALALTMSRAEMPLLVFSFHFSQLPTGLRLRLTKLAFARVNRFVVHSEIERERYSWYFGISPSRFDFVRWGVEPSSVDIEHDPPRIAGRYICALGKDGREYGTLIRAMEKLPDLPLIVVAQPKNMAGLSIPPNVKVHYDIPAAHAMNILKHSLLMALPLQASDTACGHITLVSAMFCRKAILATKSSGISDYFPRNSAAKKISPGDVDGWVRELSILMNDAALREALADEGKRFALEYCSHEAALAGTLEVFRKAGVAIGGEKGGSVPV